MSDATPQSVKPVRTATEIRLESAHDLSRIAEATEKLVGLAESFALPQREVSLAPEGGDRLADVRASEDRWGYWSVTAQRNRDTLADRIWRTDWTRVQADVFKESGKWKYGVFLDYTGEFEEDGSVHWDGPAMAARALFRATEAGTSEVTFNRIPQGWFMVVGAPPQGYPCVVWGA